MKLVTHTQGSDAWKAWRREGIGGSDVAAILGVSPYEDHTRAAVFAEKVHGTEREANFAMHRGQRLEPHARKAYQDRTRCIAPPVCVESSAGSWARVSLDGLCRPDRVAVRLEEIARLPAPARDRAMNQLAQQSVAPAGDPWILELKCPNWQTHDAALAGVVAEHFAVQCQWQMFVTQVQRLDFASFNPGDRFTPDSFPLLARWRAMPTSRDNPKPTLLDLWLAAKPQPPMPADWLAVIAVEPDHEKQAWILEEVGRFWAEVLEAREALPAKKLEPARGHGSVEAEFA